MGAVMIARPFPPGRLMLFALLLLLLPAIRAIAAGDASPAKYYVDFARGRDTNSGKSPEDPWKHAPGDPAADGRARSASLDAGDHVIFAEGTIYRGEILVTQSGKDGQPIIFEGAPGEPAVIDGSDPVTFAPCPDSQACGGLSNWRDLVLVSTERPVSGKSRLFSDRGILRPARAPDPTDSFYADEPDDLATASYAQIRTGELPLPSSARMLTKGEDARVALWVRSNVVIERPITSITGDTFHFDPESVDFYTDRPSRYAVIGLAGTLDHPGEYIILPGRRTIVAMLPNGSRALSIGEGRGGFDLQNASHIAIRNLSFRNMADGGELFRGVAVLSNTDGNRDIEVSGNHFSNMDEPRGQAPVTLRQASDLRIFNNTITGIVDGSGIRLSGPGRNVLVRNNRISRIGRTAIMLMVLEDATVENNFIDDVKGVHSNALSAYLDNRNVRFIHNTVLDAKQPATFRGASDSTQVNNIEFTENLLVGTPDALGALIAWGGTARGIAIHRNVFLGARFGLRIPSANRELMATGNVGLKPVVFPGATIDWKVENNRWFANETPAWASRLIAAARESGGSEFDCRQIFGAQVPSQIGANIKCRQ